MDILSRFRDDNAIIAKTAAGLQSFIEFTASFRQKIVEFTTASVTTTDNQVISIPITLDDGTQLVGYLDRQTYQAAVEDENSDIAVTVNDAGETVNLSGSQILDAVESTAQDLALQSEFCRNAILNSEMTRESFCTFITSKYEGIAKEKLSNYLELIEDKASDVSLKNLFSTINLTKVQKTSDEHFQNQVIEIIDPTVFTGENVWISAITNIGNTISHFFDVAWEGILKMGNFLQGIAEGLVKFSKWLLSKLFRQFSTNWDLSNKVVGIGDFPLVQIPVANWDYAPDGKSIVLSMPTWIKNLPSKPVGSNSAYGPERYFTKYDTSYSAYLLANTAFPLFGANNTGILLQGIKSMLVQSLGDGDLQEYISEIEVTIPTHAEGTYKALADLAGIQLNDWSLRLGTDEQHVIWLRIYPIMNPEWMKSATDTAIAFALNWSWACMLDHYSSTNPILFCYYNDEEELVQSSWVTNFLDSDYRLINIPQDAQTSDIGPFDIAGKVNWMFNPKSMLEGVIFYRTTEYRADWPLNIKRYFIAVSLVYRFLIPHMIMNSRGLNKLISQVQNHVWNFVDVQTVLNGYIWSGSHPLNDLGLYRLPQSQTEIETFTQAQLEIYSSEFRPYAITEKLPVLAHYQTYAEQVQEIETAIVTLAVLTAVAFAAYKFHKFKVKRQNLLTIQQGALDNMSWNLGSDPSESDLKTFRKLQKKVARTSKLNGLLGVGSGSTISNATYSLVGGLSDQIKKIRGGASDTVDPTLSDLNTGINRVITIITGE